MQPSPTTAPFDLRPVHLQNNLVRLVPLQEDDFEKLYRIASDPAIWEQHPQHDRYKREVFEKFFEDSVQSRGAFLVIDQNTDVLIGSSRYYDYNEASNSIAIGYTFLAKQYWGGAYNGALKQLMLRYIFNYVTSVVFHIGPRNIRSQKAVLKIGAYAIEETAANKEGEERLVFCIEKETFFKQHPAAEN